MKSLLPQLVLVGGEGTGHHFWAGVHKACMTMRPRPLCAVDQRLSSALWAQAPQPSDHVLALFEAGESVSDTLSLTNTVFMHLEEHDHCVLHILASKQCLSLGHFLAPP